MLKRTHGIMKLRYDENSRVANGTMRWKSLSQMMDNAGYSSFSNQFLMALSVFYDACAPTSHTSITAMSGVLQGVDSREKTRSWLAVYHSPTFSTTSPEIVVLARHIELELTNHFFLQMDNIWKMGGIEALVRESVGAAEEKVFLFPVIYCYEADMLGRGVICNSADTGRCAFGCHICPSGTAFFHRSKEEMMNKPIPRALPVRNVDILRFCMTNQSAEMTKQLCETYKIANFANPFIATPGFHPLAVPPENLHLWRLGHCKKLAFGMQKAAAFQRKQRDPQMVVDTDKAAAAWSAEYWSEIKDFPGSRRVKECIFMKKKCPTITGNDVIHNFVFLMVMAMGFGEAVAKPLIVLGLMLRIIELPFYVAADIDEYRRLLEIFVASLEPYRQTSKSCLLTINTHLLFHVGDVMAYLNALSKVTAEVSGPRVVSS